MVLYEYSLCGSIIALVCHDNVGMLKPSSVALLPHAFISHAAIQSIIYVIELRFLFLFADWAFDFL